MGNKVIELSKDEFTAIESIIDPMKRYMSVEFGRVNIFIYGRHENYILTYKEDL